jgi:hypothetical protein
VICFHQEQGISYQRPQNPNSKLKFRVYYFCSKICSDLGMQLAEKTGVINMLKLTYMERMAIERARPMFWTGCQETGIAASVMNLEPAQIDQLIAHAVEGFRIEMQKMSKLDDEIPF